MKTIDLNADLGEGYDDGAVMPHISSANIACGFHAGDAETMHRTVELCVQHGVAIGAHPSLPDRVGFGRREMEVSPDEVYAQTLYQIGALAGIANATGAKLHHVKPHGALYNMAARERALADAIARAVRDFDPDLILVGLAGSASITAARDTGLARAQEAFCDRRYRSDGSLTARSQHGSVLEDIDEAVAQAVSLATRGEAIADDGSRVRLQADTLCVHGDRANAGEFARRLREALEQTGLRVAAPERT
ncbi:MAG TPA: 5-oxoprolinase subunit PxpA [Rhodanobacteraceae bacterium]|nr:5-oxoprolinase subunit PxpA [Rhodanobacteraceae bacterium]